MPENPAKCYIEFTVSQTRSVSLASRYLVDGHKGMDIRHANALSRTLSERKQISIQEIGFVGITPARRVECLGIGEEVLVMVHCP